MSFREQTLLEYLTLPNPAVDGEACSKGSNTKSTKREYSYPREICDWEDFRFDTLNAFWDGDLGKALKEDFILQDFSEIPTFPFCHYFDENSLESLLVKWNQSIVSEALAKAQKFLDRGSNPVFMVKGGQTEPLPQKLKPDWGCVRLRDSGPYLKRKNLLPGETKVSPKWRSAYIDKRPGNSKRVWMRPINQIFSYCVENNTRYGYIITDAELVAVRVRLGPQDNPRASSKSVKVHARDNSILEYKAIPWTGIDEDGRENSDKMTINLALWWLHLIATGKTEIEKHYASLRDIGWEPPDSQGLSSFSHSFSQSFDKPGEDFQDWDPVAEQSQDRISFAEDQERSFDDMELDEVSLL